MFTDQSFIANLAAKNSQLRKAAWDNLFWARWAGEVQIKRNGDNGQNTYIPSGKPIEIMNEFVHESTDNMLIPFLNSLTGDPVFGDTVLQGTGESMSMKWLRAYVNQIRKAVMKKEGNMSLQRQKYLNLLDQAKPQLADWFSKWNNTEIFRAFYEGASLNLTSSKAVDGLGLYKRYHPNWYYQSADGTLTAVGTEKKTKTAANLDTAVSAVDGLETTAKTLRALHVLCANLLIPRLVTKNGQKYWILLVHPSTLARLKVDSDYKAAQRDAFTSKMLDAPELSGAAGYYDGFAIFEDNLGIRGWSSGLFGSTFSDACRPTSIETNTNMIVFGNSAMGKGIAEKLSFTEEKSDHGNIVEIGGREIAGYNRPDFVAEDDAGEASSALFYKNTTGGVADGIECVNQSSLILMTDEG